MRTGMPLWRTRPEPTDESTRVPLRAPPALSHALPVDRARGHHRGRARPRLPRSRDGRGAPGRRQAAAARALAVQAAVGGREPPVLQLVRPTGAEGPQRLPDVRSPHGAARLLRAPPMTVPRALLLSLVAVAGIAAGCGGGSVDYNTPEAKYVPPLTAPPQGSGSSTSATTSTTATTTTATTAAPTTGSTGGTSAGTATPAPAPSGAATGGAGTTGGGAGGTTTTPQNTGGADFNTFCQENP